MRMATSALHLTVNDKLEISLVLKLFARRQMSGLNQFACRCASHTLWVTICVRPATHWVGYSSTNGHSGIACFDMPFIQSCVQLLPITEAFPS
jgi:hypothetical protein